MSSKKVATWLVVQGLTTPRQVFKPDIKINLQTLPLELQEKIYKDIWQGLARAKFKLVTVELFVSRNSQEESERSQPRSSMSLDQGCVHSFLFFSL